MAGKNVQYNLQIHADSAQAKRQLEDLSTTLSKISNMHIKTTVEDSAIEKASEAAKELQKHLQGATNVDTGKLNLTAFNKSLTNANTSVSELSRSLLEAGTLGQQAFTQLSAAIANTEVPIRQVNKTLQTWGTTLKNTAKWEISSTIVHGLESALSGAVGYARDLNKSLTDIRIVTGQSVEDMARFAQQANRAAKELSTSTKAYTDASLIYYQQGDSDEIVAQKAAITLKAANSSFKTSAAEMSEYLTAVWNSYKVGADELEHYVDIMAALGAKTATSLEEIATSMQKVAATGNTVGVSMEQVSSIIATVSSVTRESAESIGTSYKTIFARIGDLKLGKTDEEGIGLGQVSSQLETIGVDILDTSGNLRDMGDIITDLGNKWQTMTEAQKTATAQVVAGKRQYTQLMALFENWDMYQSNIDIAENSEGALQNMQDIYAESWESASKRVQASLEGIYNSLLNDQAFIKVLNFIDKIVESVGGMVKGLGGVEGIIFNIGGLMSNLFSADIAQGMTKAFTTISGLFKKAGTEQQQYLANSKAIRAELEATVQDNTLINQSAQYENTGIIEVMKAKERMVESSRNLTAEQQSHIEGVIAAYQKEVAAIVEVQKAQDKAKMDADIKEEQLKSRVLQEEMRSVAKRSGTTDYELLDRSDREAAYKLAQESLISDALNLDLEVDVKLDDGQVKKEMSTVQAELNKVFGTTKGLTFDKLISESKTLTTQLGQTKNVLAQLKVMTGENGIDLFAANKSTNEILSDLQHMADAYKEITGEDLQFEITGLNGVKEQITDLGKVTNLTKEQMQEVATQMVQQFSNLENVTAQKVTAIKNALLRIVPPELQGEFQKLFAKWEEMAILGESSSHRVEKAMKDALKRMNQEMEQTFSKFSKNLENMIKIGSSLSSVWGIVNTISGTIETLKDPETTGWEKFGAVLGAVSSVLMSVKTVSDGAAAVMSIINSLVAIGTGLEIANTKAKQANTEATKNKTKAQLEGVAAQVAENAGNVADTADEVADTITSAASKGSLAWMGFKNVITTKVGPALLSFAKIAWPVALIAGIAAITAAAIKAAKTIEENFQKSILKTKEALDKNEQATADLMNNTAKLDQIMKDNTLTYEQKIEKINEITKAYGFQADAIDVLTGSYSGLQDKMLTTLRSDLKGQIQEAKDLTVEGQYQADRSAYQAPAGGIPFHYFGSARTFNSYEDYSQKFDQALENLEKHYMAYDGVIDEHERSLINNEMLTGFGSTIKITDRDQWAQNLTYNGQAASGFDLEEYTYDTIMAAFGVEEKAIGGLFSTFNDTQSGAARASLLADEAWTNRHPNWTNNGNISGILNAQNLGEYETDFSEEGKMWLDYADELARFGLIFDKVNAQITGIIGQDINYQDFYNWMQGQEDIMNLVNSGAETYTGQIYSILSNKGFGNVYRGSEITNNTQALLNLIEDPNFYKHILTTDPNDKVDAATLQQMYKNHVFTTDNIQYANEMLGGYGAYEEATQILDYLYSVAEESATDSVSATDIVDTILSSWNGQDGKQEMTLDIALRLKPTDIEIVDGEAQIKSEVEEYINSQATLASKKAKTQTWQANKSLLTQSNYDANSIAQMQALWDAEGYASSVGYTADEFMLLSEATRGALFEDINTQNLKAEQEAYDTNLKILEQRRNATAEALTIYSEADNKVQTLLSGNDELISAITTHSGGATDWKAIKDYKAFVDAEIVNLEEQLNAYEAIDKDTSLTDAEKKAKKAEIFTDEKALRAAKERKAELVLEQKALNTAMQEGIAIESAATTAASDHDAAIQRQQTVKLEKIQQERQKVEKAASLWNQAITNMGNLSADQLSELFVLDKDAKDKYGTEEWTEYAYNNAMQYYAELEMLYAGDAAKLAEIAQQKQDTNRAYYTEMSTISQAAYNREKTRLQQTLEAQKEVAAAMSETLQEGNLSAQQKLALGDKASTWESATRQERLSMYGATLGQETLAQIELNNQARGMSQSAIESKALLSAGLGPIASASKVAKEMATAWQKEFTEAMTSTDEGALEAFFGKNMDVFDEATRQIFLNINKQTKGASLSASEIWDLYLAELNKVDDANDQVWASFEDNAVKAIMATIEAEQQAAQEIVDIWKQAIKDIHAARMGLADGQSVAQTFANDEEGLVNVVAQLRAQGKTDAEIDALINSQDADKSQLTVSNLSMKEFGASQGITSAINTESGNLIQNFNNWLRLVKNRIITQANDLFTNADAETKEAFEKWKSENGGGTFADYLIEAYGLNDESKAQDLYNQRYGEAWVHRNMYGIDGQGGTVNTQQAFDEAVSRYNDTVSTNQQDADDWYAIMQGIDKVRAGDASDLYSALGKDADGIMARLGYETKGDLNAVDYETAQANFKTANANITAAQVTLTGDLTTAGILKQDGTVDETAGFMKSDVEKVLDQATADATAARYEPRQVEQEHMQSELDLADTRQSAISGILDASTMEEMATAANTLREAYAGADEETQQWVEDLIKAREAGKDGLSANKKLTSQHVRGAKDLAKMSKAQREQYKEMLRANKVTVDGYKDLKEYFKVVDATGKAVDEMQEHVDDFSMDQYSDALSDGVASTEDTAQMVENILPESMRSATDEIMEISDTVAKGGTIFDALSGWLQDDGTFTQSINDVLNTMGLGADQIAAMQASVQAQVETNGSVGAVDWLQVFADANVDPTQFDSIIEALNSAMAQIQAYLADNGVELDPPWTPVPTLGSMGVGRGNGGSGGGSRGGKGGGGGGGSKNKEKKEYKRFQDENERYHVQNETLDRIGEQLDKIDKLKDAAYGSQHLAQLDAETKALKEQYEAQVDLYNEAMKYQAADRADLIGLNVGVQFDENGTITNYEEVIQKLIDRYNTAVERYNNSEQEEGDKLRLEDAEEAYDDAITAIENYEEAVATANEAQNEMLDILNQLSEIELEKITYELELNLEINEKDIELLEYFQSKYEDTLHAQDELFGSLMESAAQYEDNLSAIDRAYRDLLGAYTSGTINEADYAEGLKELSDQMIENLNNLQDVADEIAETYTDTLELAREEVDKTAATLEHFNSVMESYINIAGLSGKTFFGSDGEEVINSYKGLDAFYDAQYKNNLNRILIHREHLNVLTEEEDKFRDKIEAGQQLTELEKQQYAALQEQIQETREQVLSATEETLETLQAGYENTINGIAQDLDEFMAGAAGSIAHLADQYAYFQEEQERYISTAKELYEVSQLTRDIENSISEASTKASKEALKALQEKINKQSELNELTEYDIEMNQLQYQLLLARIQLEEAQNAKDTVRLTRDDNGNYAYQYTADQNKVDEAVQHYEDVLQQINDLTTQRTSEIEQQMIDAMQSYKDQFQEIALDQTLTAEQRNERLAELNNRFSETMLYLQEQNGIVTENLTLNQEAIAEHYGVSMADITASTAGNVNETVQSMIDKTQEYINAMNQAIYGEDGANSAWKEYAERMGIVNNASGTAYEDMLNNTEELGEMNEYATEEALNTLQTLEETIKPLGNLTEAWDAHNEVLENTITYYEQLANNIHKVMSIIGETGTSGGITTGITSFMPNQSAINSYEEIIAAEQLNQALHGNDEKLEEMHQNELASGGDGGNSKNKYAQSGFNYDAITDYVDAMTYQTLLSQLFAQGLDNMSAQEIVQQITIEAEFPNVTDQYEIMAAFDTMANNAAQFASRKN